MSPSFALITTCARDETFINRSYFTSQMPIESFANSPHTTVKKKVSIKVLMHNYSPNIKYIMNVILGGESR
jgi:hypothetical protein